MRTDLPKNKLEYIAPEVSLCEIGVEHGFATSNPLNGRIDKTDFESWDEE